MLQARTISISINRSWETVYEAIWRPESFPKWASGLGKASLTKVGDVWTADGPEGPITISFTDHNVFGVMDHYVDTGNGSKIYVPLRIVPNGDGAVVLLTLFRQPGMSADKFDADAAWVARDLKSLKEFVTR
ncbi:MAG TPA: SRPBCC family protein [Woeseiaceae bacterium]|nr:SRPBCC family protein [Woeseiaceae bacterium]